MIGLYGLYGPMPAVASGLIRNWVSLTVALGIFGLSGLTSRIAIDSGPGRLFGVLAAETYVVYLAHPLVLLSIGKAVDTRALGVRWADPLVFAALYAIVVAVSFGGAATWHRVRAAIHVRRRASIQNSEIGSE